MLDLSPNREQEELREHVHASVGEGAFWLHETMQAGPSSSSTVP